MRNSISVLPNAGTPIDLLTTRELASALRLSPATLQLWRRTGRGPRYLKIGKSVRYRVSDVQEWLEAHAPVATVRQKRKVA